MEERKLNFDIQGHEQQHFIWRAKQSIDLVFKNVLLIRLVADVLWKKAI